MLSIHYPESRNKLIRLTDWAERRFLSFALVFMFLLAAAAVGTYIRLPASMRGGISSKLEAMHAEVFLAREYFYEIKEMRGEQILQEYRRRELVEEIYTELRRRGAQR